MTKLGQVETDQCKAKPLQAGLQDNHVWKPAFTQDLLTQSTKGSNLLQSWTCADSMPWLSIDSSVSISTLLSSPSEPFRILNASRR